MPRASACPRPRRSAWPLLILVTPLLASCFPPQASFRAGFGTTEIVGTVEGADPAMGVPLVIAYKYHHQFVALDSEPAVTHPSAHVVVVGPSGEFRVSMPSDVTSMELFFVAPERLTDLFHFSRQLGVGTVVYRAGLKPMPNWRSHFYGYLEPELEHLIVEPRYRLSAPDQARLAEWISGQQRRLEAARATPAAERPAVPVR
jgi:hypothetical protein